LALAAALPGGWILFSAATDFGLSYDDATIRVMSPDGKQVKTILRGGYYPRYASSGHLLYVHRELYSPRNSTSTGWNSGATLFRLRTIWRAPPRRARVSSISREMERSCI
jgi:hypothetical protein